jgi:hypothetical protein
VENKATCLGHHQEIRHGLIRRGQHEIQVFLQALKLTIAKHPAGLAGAEGADTGIERRCFLPFHHPPRACAEYHHHQAGQHGGQKRDAQAERGFHDGLRMR